MNRIQTIIAVFDLTAIAGPGCYRRILIQDFNSLDENLATGIAAEDYRYRSIDRFVFGPSGPR